MGDKVPGCTDKKPKKEKTVKDAPKDKKDLIFKLNLIYINMKTKFRYNLLKII